MIYQDDTNKLSLDRILYESIANYICRLAKKYAPVDTGYLRDNIEVVIDDELVTVVSFAEYSLFVHEAIDNAHNVGRAKFLEDAAIDVYNWFNGRFDFEIQYEPVLLVKINGIDTRKKKISQVVNDIERDIGSLLDEFGW